MGIRELVIYVNIENLSLPSACYKVTSFRLVFLKCSVVLLLLLDLLLSMLDM